MFSATPWCRALVTTAPSPPSCLLYPRTRSLRKKRKQAFIWLSKCFNFKVTHIQILTPTMVSHRDIKKKLQLIQDNQNWTSLHWIPTILNTLSLCIKYSRPFHWTQAYNTPSFNGEKHNAKRFCSFMHQFERKHLFLRLVHTIHQVLTCFSVFHKWNWKLLPRLTKCIWIRDRICDTPGTNTYAQHSCAETCMIETTDSAAPHFIDVKNKRVCTQVHSYRQTRAYRHDILLTLERRKSPPSAH